MLKNGVLLYDMYYIFTDGSCTGKADERKASWGVVIYDSNQMLVKEMSGQITDFVTNQRGEMMGMKVALDEAEPDSVIHSDSIYCIKCITEWSVNWKKNGWKTSKNEDVKHRDLIEGMLDTYETKNVKLVHVKGHQKGDSFIINGNNHADRVATGKSILKC